MWIIYENFYVAFWFYKKKKKNANFAVTKLNKIFIWWISVRSINWRLKWLEKTTTRFDLIVVLVFFKKSVKIKNYKLLLSNYNNKSNLCWSCTNNSLIIIGSSNSNWKSKCCFSVIISVLHKSDWWCTIRMYKILSSNSRS